MADESDPPTYAPANTSDVSARLQNLRNLLSSERHFSADQRRALEAFDQEVDALNASNEQRRLVMERLHARNDRRRPYVDSVFQEGRDTGQVPSPLPASTSPSALVRTRRRAFRPSERLSRSQRERLGQGGITSPQPYTNPPPRNSPPLPNPDNAVREYMAEAVINRELRRFAKRRKLEDGTFEGESKAFSYGYKGQVVPGQLRLEIVSCDGGEYSDPHTLINSWPENVLQDDQTVYCTKGNRCNMLLKHVGGMPFSLTKIVVNAPRSGYDAPIQEGMIFVAMNDDKLLEKTSQYEINYSPRNYRYHRQRYIDRYAPSHSYLHSTRSPLRSIDRSRTLRGSDTISNRDAFLRHEALATAVVPGFDVTIENPSDTEENPGWAPTPRPWISSDRNRRVYSDFSRVHPDRRPPEADQDVSTTSSDSEDADIFGPLNTRAVLDTIARGQDPTGLSNPQQWREDAEVVAGNQYYTDEEEDVRDHDHDRDHYLNRRSTPSRIGLRTNYGAGLGAPDPMNPGGTNHERSTSDDDHPSSSKVASDPATSSATAAASDVIAPHARFFIQRFKSSVAVNFDPPVAGRYVLIKFWAPCPDTNIDIQSIIAHGYGGPRFFPGVEMR